MENIDWSLVRQFILFYLVIGFFYASCILEVREHDPEYELIRVKKLLIRTRTKHQAIFLTKMTLIWLWHALRQLWRTYKSFKTRIRED